MTGWLKWFTTPAARAIKGFPLADLPPVGDPDRGWRMLTAWWQATDSDVSFTPVSDAEVDALARRYDVVLPDDFRAYLRNIRPVDDALDHEMGTWWPVSRVRNLLDEPDCRSPELADDGGRHLLFADHLMWSCGWAISCEPGETHGQVIRVSGTLATVADSFTEFVERYTTDWASIA